MIEMVRVSVNGEPHELPIPITVEGFGPALHAVQRAFIDGPYRPPPRMRLPFL